MNISLLPEDYPDFQEFGTPPCAESDPDAFFSQEPLEGALIRRTRYDYEREAKQVCFECPYRARCLQYALKDPDLVGIWGGTTEKDRGRIRNGLPVRVGLPPKRHQ